MLTSRKTLLPVDKPCAALHVTVKVDPTLAYVEVIPGSFSTIRSAKRSPAKRVMSVGI